MSLFKIDSQDISDSSEPQQLSFDQLEKLSFQAHDLDFVEKTQQPQAATAVPAKMNLSYAFAETEKESQTTRFIGLSALAHGVLIVMASLVTIPLVEKAKVETITIEIEETSAAPKGLTQDKTKAGAPGLTVAQAAADQALAVQQEKQQASALNSDSKDEMAVALRPETSVPVKTQAAKTALAPLKNSKSTAKKGPRAAARMAPVMRGKSSKAPSLMTAAESPVVVPETIEDIQAPELDVAALKNASVGSLEDKDFSEDLDRVDQKNKLVTERERARLLKQADDLSKENDEAVNAAEEDLKKENQKVMAMNRSRRNQEAQEAAQQAAAEAAAAHQARLAGLAAARERAAAQAAAGKSNGGMGTAANSATTGSGTLKNGNSGSGGDPMGSPDGTGLGGVGAVRALEDLKQMPGNPKPTYDHQERLLGHQGSARFLAYINKEGRTSQFRLLQSTGYRNLDAKTLAALKKWRFYPGQEGWVEIPIQWNLKGGVQEMPTLLRRARN